MCLRVPFNCFSCSCSRKSILFLLISENIYCDTVPMPRVIYNCYASFDDTLENVNCSGGTYSRMTLHLNSFPVILFSRKSYYLSVSSPNMHWQISICFNPCSSFKHVVAFFFSLDMSNKTMEILHLVCGRWHDLKM